MTLVRVAVLGGGRSSEHEVSLAGGVGRRAAGGRPRRHRVTLERDGAWLLDGTGSSRCAPGRGLLGRRRRVPGAARPVRRGRHGPGAARAARRAVRRRGRAGQRAVHGQGRLQGADGAAPACRRSTTGRSATSGSRPTRRRSRRAGGARAAGVRQARAAGLVGRDRQGRGGRRACAARSTRRSSTTRCVIVEAARRARGRVLGARQPRAGRLASRARSCSRPGERWYDYEAKYEPGGMELRVPPRGSRRRRPRAGARAGGARPSGRSGCSRPRAGGLLRRGRAGAPQRAQHDARLHADERLRGAVRGSGIAYPELVERLVRAGDRAPRRAAAISVLKSVQ